MNCTVALSNVACNTFSNISSLTTNNMVKFLETPISTTNRVYSHETTLMKRKRPAKISIPVSKLNAFVDKSTSECVDVIEVEGDGYGVFCKKGRTRARLEDRYSVIVNNVHGLPNQAFFGVYDGHGGEKAAEFAASRLGNKIIGNVGRKGVKESTKSKEFIEGIIKDGYLDTDKEFLSENSIGGTCCVTALIQEGTLVVSNVGDCRGVLSRGGVAEALTTDHTPAREDEKLKIESKGGYVDKCHGMWRVQGSLAVSRAIGDKHLKQWITSEPDTNILDIQPYCDFLILASDGLWTKVTNQEAVDVIRLSCETEANRDELTSACRKLVELSISRGSNDDTSVMVVHLGRFVTRIS